MMQALITSLRRHRGRWLTLDALQAQLHCPPPDIFAAVHELKNLGHDIEIAPPCAVRLATAPPSLNADVLQYGLNTRRVGKQVMVYQETDSTNDIAWRHAHLPDFDGLAVFAEAQRRGRGRLGRTWFDTPAQSILCSVLLRETNDRLSHPLSIMIALAVALTLENCFDLKPAVKWPNDVTLDRRKVSGTIVETKRVDKKIHHVLGVGVNCLQSGNDFDTLLRPHAVSVSQALSAPVDRLEIAQALLQNLDDLLNTFQNDLGRSLHRQWLARCADIGRRLTVRHNGLCFTGRALDIDIKQGLLIQLDHGPVRIFDGATTTVCR